MQVLGKYIRRSCAMKLYISTFGGFDIKVDGESVLKKSSRTYKLYKLFEYFITFRNKKLLPETIIDYLWSDSESCDPKNVLRTQIFRLRQIIKTLFPDGLDERDYLSINFINGCYCLEMGEKAILDLDEFENIITQADLEISNDVEKAITLYDDAIKMYKGLYLADNVYEVWLIPSRNYYHRLYLKILYKLINLLNEKDDSETIIELCEKSLLIESYEENIHIALMEAMIKLGKIKNAMEHYEHAVDLLEKEMDIKPSLKFVGVLDKIKTNISQKSNIDFLDISKKLNFETPIGAINCNFDHFKFLFNIQRRKGFRNNEYDYLSIITLSRIEEKYKSLKFSSSLISDLDRLLTFSLRKGDIFTFWNENQILIMLHDVRGDGTKKIEERIRKNLKNYTIINNRDFYMDFRPLISENPLL
jgi:DNA-binding SARP family transcriptional activator